MVRRSALQPAKVTALSFAILIVIGTILLMLPICWVDGSPDALVALFTATSAVCVTGLVVVDTGSAFTTFGQVVIMLLIQIGGIGYMTMATTVAVIIGRELSVSQRLMLRESQGRLELAGVIRLARNTFLFALLVELVAAIILSIRFAYDPSINGLRAIYFGVFHAISGFCNAGFDLMGPIHGEYSSLIHYRMDPAVVLTIAALITLGSLGFPVIDEVLHKQKRRFSLHSRLVLWVTVVLTVGGALGFLLIEWSNPLTIGNDSFGGKLMNSFFQSVSRTAGFSTVDMSGLHATTLIMIGVLMFIGGSPGGVAGGIKTTTFVLIVVAIISVIKGRTDSEVFGKRIPPSNTYRALAIAGLAASIVTVVTMVMTYLEIKTPGLAELAIFLELQFEVLSAWGTVGYSTGITRDLSSAGQMILIGVMYVGRIGPLTAFVALASRERTARRRLAEEHVVIGS